VRDSESGDVIVKVVNGDDAPATCQIEFNGLAEGEVPATKMLLSGPAGDAFNDDGKPAVVQPVVSEEKLRPTFEYEAPANSLTVFRVHRD
jgi:alpha-L-arabinofuranosidase